MSDITSVTSAASQALERAREQQQTSKAAESQNKAAATETQQTSSINENDSTEITEANEEDGTGESGQTNAGPVLDFLKSLFGTEKSSAPSRPSTSERIEEAKTNSGEATNEITDAKTMEELQSVEGYKDILNHAYDNAVPEVKELYEKFEGQIKISDGDLLTREELSSFNNDFSSSMSDRIKEMKNSGDSEQVKAAEQWEKTNVKNLLENAQGNDAASNQKLASMLNSLYGEDNLDSLKSLVMDSLAGKGEDDILAAVSNASNPTDVANAISALTSEGSYYTSGSKSVYIDINTDLTVNEPPGRTYFHEVGHLMDDASMTQDSGSYYMMSDTEQFRGAITSDFNNYVAGYKEDNQKELSKIQAAIEKGSDKGLNDEQKKIYNYVENLQNNGSELLEKYSMEDIIAYRSISADIKGSQASDLDPSKSQTELYRSIGDIFGGLTDNMAQGAYGHSNEYWNRESSLSSEMFAHFFQSSMTNDSELEALKAIFPTAYSEFMSMVETASAS